MNELLILCASIYTSGFFMLQVNWKAGMFPWRVSPRLSTIISALWPLVLIPLAFFGLYITILGIYSVTLKPLIKDKF